MKLEFSVQMFEKYTNSKHYKNPFSESRFVSCRRTDRESWRSK